MTFTATGRRSLDVEVLTETDGFRSGCLPAPACLDCSVTLAATESALLRRTREYPSVDNREDFQLSVTVAVP